MKANGISPLIFLLYTECNGLPFQNLDFEEAKTQNTVIYQAEPLCGKIGPADELLPAWTIRKDGDQAMQEIGFNLLCYPVTLVSDAIILDPTMGKYSLYIDEIDFNNSTVSQEGIVPVGAKTIQYDITGAPLELWINGTQQEVKYGEVSYYHFYTCKADVTDYAGEHIDLFFRKTSWPIYYESILDNIRFSQEAIPEPSTIMLIGIGSALFLLRKNQR